MTRIATITLSAILAVAATSAGWAQGRPGQGRQRLLRRARSPAALPSFGDPVFETSNDPAGVMDGTDPDPDPYQAGGILSPEAAAHGWGR